MHEKTLAQASQRQSERVRVLAPVRAVERHPVLLPLRVRRTSSPMSNFGVLANRGSDSISQRTGGLGSGRPASSRDKIEEKSKRKLSTCIWVTQYRRLSWISWRPIGWLAFSMLPQPV